MSNLNFNNKDVKTFFLGMVASMAAVIAWDVVKKSLKIFNYEVKKTNKEI